MSYQEEDSPFFDYKMTSFVGLDIRGPVPDLEKDFFVCVGAAQSFGRYVHRPYIDLIADRVGIPGLNLSVGGAGPTMFQTEARLEAINKARFVIIQVMSARAEANSIFGSDGKSTLQVKVEGLHFSDATTQSQIHAQSINQAVKILPDLKVPLGIQMHSTVAYQILSECKDDLVCEMAIQESKMRYVASMAALLKQISRPKYLLYFSERSPQIVRNTALGERKFRNAFDIEGIYPQFVDNEVMELIGLHADGVAYCASTRGKPHRLPDGMTQLMANGLLEPITFNGYYPSPEMHYDAAEAIFEDLNIFDVIHS